MGFALIGIKVAVSVKNSVNLTIRRLKNADMLIFVQDQTVLSGMMFAENTLF